MSATLSARPQGLWSSIARLLPWTPATPRYAPLGEAATVTEDIDKQIDDEDVDLDGGAESPQDGALDWTEEEEKRLVRKIDFLIMPLLVVAFLALQFDRGNIGNALTDFFLEDVGITQNQFNAGQQLLWLGIVLLEIPSNFILYRVGPSVWLSCQIFAWGLVATFQAFQKGFPAFLITRLLLGICESGYIPAGLYTITRWYKQDETSTRFSIYFVGNMFAQATSGVTAYGILRMRGIFSLAGWQWLFIIEGLFTVLVGCVFVLFFPRGPSDPVSLAGFVYFSDREKAIMSQRVLRDDPRKCHQGESITRQEIRDTFTNWRLIPHVAFTITGLAPSSTLYSYGPTLVKSFGYGRLASNAYASVGPWIQLFVNIAFGFIADSIHMRGPVVFLGGALWLVFTLGSRGLIYSSDGSARYAFLTIAYAFSTPWHPVNGSWMALNARSSGERSITMAICIMSANAAGIIGSQLFRSEDGPYYPVGWAAIVSLNTFALICMGIACLQYYFSNRMLKEKGQTPTWHH